MTTPTSLPVVRDPAGGAPYRVLARGGEGPMPAYRICALAALEDGSLLAVFDGRDSWNDVPDPTGLFLRRSSDGGESWGPIEPLRPPEREARIWSTDPSLIVDRDTGTVHLFHTRAKDRGFWDAVPGTDDSARDVLGSALATSHDHGATWTFRSLTATAQPFPTHGAFATSGAGIQLRVGTHRGRLVQPYCAWHPADLARAKADREGTAVEAPTETVRSFVLFSDDHGETWQRGEPTGSAMDETTIAELSDGRLLLSSRDHHKGGHRRRSVSADGGVSWQHLGLDEDLVDPGNNAQLARRSPDAPGSDPRSRELWLTSTWDPAERRRGTLHLSRDDGESWQEILVFAPGACEYSVVVALPDGGVALLWEVDAAEIRFARLEAKELESVRADAARSATAGAGSAGAGSGRARTEG
ncbi:neuramidase [Brachybacterium endophyticum]|uniref:exo-alpha-sialidase n=1 Tax=Brachybacterium endophyticum TaxID=2182385 RepID=A0A2U2RGV6_9MICO|nr:sialidase family protein [Brachybacterium endophyticum]PWH05078.1 neuramidase [Brachybacterium endophyticum]